MWKRNSESHFFCPVLSSYLCACGFGAWSIFKEWWKLTTCEMFKKSQQWIAGCSCCRLVLYTLTTTGKFDFFCSWLFSSKHVICFVSCCWFRSAVTWCSASDSSANAYDFVLFHGFFSFSLYFLLVQHSGASHMESVQREVIYWKLWKLSTFHLLKMSPRQRKCSQDIGTGSQTSLTSVMERNVGINLLAMQTMWILL